MRPGPSTMVTRRSRERLVCRTRCEVQMGIIGEAASRYWNAVESHHRITTVIPLLPLPRSPSPFNSGMRLIRSQDRSSLVRQFSP